MINKYIPPQEANIKEFNTVNENVIITNKKIYISALNSNKSIEVYDIKEITHIKYTNKTKPQLLIIGIVLTIALIIIAFLAQNETTTGFCAGGAVLSFILFSIIYLATQSHVISFGITSSQVRTLSPADITQNNVQEIITKIFELKHY